MARDNCGKGRRPRHPTWHDARMSGPDRLLSTGDAARALAVDRRTLQRWHTDGKVQPHSRTVGGHLRWDLNDLRDQIRKLQEN
jgi:hypothetical protein